MGYTSSLFGEERDAVEGVFGNGRKVQFVARRLNGEPMAFVAVSGRVMTLLVEADRVIPGHLDSLNGTVIRSAPDRLLEQYGCTPLIMTVSQTIAVVTITVLGSLLAMAVLRRGGR
jgi:hypothetical protein